MKRRVDSSELLSAARAGDLDLVRSLVTKKLNLDASDENGQTAAMEAAAEGHLEVLRLLHEKGAKLDGRYQSTGLNVLYYFGEQAKNRPRNMVVHKGGKKLKSKKAIRKVLGEHPDDEYGRHVECARFLVENGVPVDVVGGEYRQTALHVAADAAALELVEVLLDGDADPMIRDQWGLTPLHYACRNPEVKIVERMIESGADVNVADKLGFTPLHEAAENGQLAIANTLLSLGANRKLGLIANHEAYKKGATARDVAVKKKQAAIAKLLGGRK